jgi:hypothetical protein
MSKLYFYLLNIYNSNKYQGKTETPLKILDLSDI